jgi:hypothetical protein
MCCVVVQCSVMGGVYCLGSRYSTHVIIELSTVILQRHAWSHGDTLIYAQVYFITHIEQGLFLFTKDHIVFSWPLSQFRA